MFLQLANLAVQTSTVSHWHALSVSRSGRTLAFAGVDFRAGSVFAGVGHHTVRFGRRAVGQ